MSITKFMLAIGPIHERDLPDIVKKNSDYPDVRVSVYDGGGATVKRVIRKSGTRTHKKVTADGIAAMQQLRDNGNNKSEVARLTGYSKSTVARYTHEPILRMAHGKELLK